jgi:predicted nuclease of predicted toxin-antitoxin system
LNTKLKLLVDESVDDPVADSISKMPAFNAIFVRELDALRGKSDKAVMAHAQEQERIVLTMDDGFNRNNYPVCRHHGIIRIKTKCKHSMIVTEAIQKFVRCGRRVLARHAITDISQGKATIETTEGIREIRYRSQSKGRQ